MARGVDPAAEGSAGEAEQAEQARIGEPDVGRAVRRDPPDARLVVGDVEIAGLVEREVVPHGEHPVAGNPAVGRHLREDLWRPGVPAKPDGQDPAVHVGHEELVRRPRVAVEGEPEQAHVRVVRGVDDRRVEETAVTVVGEDTLVLGVQVAAVRRIREEVAGTRRDVDPAIADGDPEWMAGRRRRGKDGHGVAAGMAGGDRADPRARRHQRSYRGDPQDLEPNPVLAAHGKPSSLRARLAVSISIPSPERRRATRGIDIRRSGTGGRVDMRGWGRLRRPGLIDSRRSTRTCSDAHGETLRGGSSLR